MIISNSSPLIALGRINRLDIFHTLFDSIYIPYAVYQETVLNTKLSHQKEAILKAIDADIINVLTPSMAYPFQRKLGVGEQAVLNLALEKQAKLVIVDDRKARQVAKRLGLSVAYTTDILKAADKRKLLTSYEEMLTQLREIGIYLPN